MGVAGSNWEQWERLGVTGSNWEHWDGWFLGGPCFLFLDLGVMGNF